MTVRLDELQACFEGVIPSIIATVSADGTPNVSYLSHVVLIDEQHIGLSNQYFSKTAANVRENPRAALLLVDARTGEQFHLEIHYVESRSDGKVFDHVRSHLEASSAQVGMAGIFRLRAIDVYRVSAIARAPSSASKAIAVSPVRRLMDAARVVEAIAAQADAEGIVEAVLDGLGTRFGYESISLLLRDPARAVLVTVASRGYDRAGVGSEVPFGEGVIGSAAAQARPMRVSDMSRVRRLVMAIRDSSDHENRTRTIPLPGMEGVRSQIAVPLIVQGAVRGALFAESREPLKFTVDDEDALTIVARQAALALALAENMSEALAPDEEQSGRQSIPAGRPFKVMHYAYDDSVFIDEQYVIKGVPGRLLMFMLEIHVRDGRCEFSNRELRLAPAIRLPDIKDNLETRLLLLRRRLEEKASPVRLARTGRGRIELRMAGRPLIECAAAESQPKH